MLVNIAGVNSNLYRLPARAGSMGFHLHIPWDKAPCVPITAESGRLEAVTCNYSGGWTYLCMRYQQKRECKKMSFISLEEGRKLLYYAALLG